ncbi:uncharacterized protein LOC116774674 isoform X2 [Danaus plexippus]|uniref:uncharacterized protein LOC116774674 isoform X2 n=1 Tax=Danaus plexippus TaxID=13037 RepID=UPI002AB09DC2|nr:uncharacterized protein LOC116774674 isoform X2 [Danaus plexippus]
MDVNNSHNQSYWFVVREDQSNVIFSSNNFTIQNPQSQGGRYIVDAVDNRQYIHVDNVPPVPEDIPKNCVKDSLHKEDENFWDRNKVKVLLTLCLENRFSSPDKDKIAWNEIALLVGTTPEECDKKYRNLRRTYIRLLKKKRLGKDIKWVHYNICEEVFKDCKSLSPSIFEPWEDSKVRRLLSLYIENINKFRNPDCLQKDIWKEIACLLNTTEYNCYHKFKNLKRTYFNWVERSRESGKLIKWPYHHYFERIYFNYNPNLGPWDRNKIRLLINAYSELAHKFKNPKYQKKELWKDISKKVNEAPSNCDRKFRNLKQTYIRLKMRADTGRAVTKWRYYKDFVAIFENNCCSVLDDGHNVVYKTLEQDYVKQLLNFYLDNKNKFKDPLVKKKTLWKQIGPKLGLSPEECDKKFRNLKQTYIRLADKLKETGKGNGWPYYAYFEQIYDEPSSGGKECHHKCDLDTMTLTEIRNLVHDHGLKDRDKFDRLVRVIEDSNDIQRERNKILQALLDRR